MKVRLFRYFLLFFIFIVFVVFYMTTIGLETTKFNNQIKNKISKIDENLNLDLKKIKLTLDPFNFKINAKTIGAIIYYSKTPLSLEYIKTQISFISLIKNKFVSSNLELATRSILLKDLVRFFRTTTNKPYLIFLESMISKGHTILELNLNFDENGNIKSDYKLKGFLNDGKINFFKNSGVQNLNFNFLFQNNKFSLEEIKFSSNNVNFTSDKLDAIISNHNSLLFEGTIENQKTKFNKNFLKLFKLNLDEIDFSEVNFASKNKFSFEIDRKFNFKKFVLNTDISFDQLKYNTPNLIRNYIADINEKVVFKDHRLKINYKKNNLSIVGKGKIKLNKNYNEFEYLIDKDKNNLYLNSDIILKNINLKKNNYFKIFFPKVNEKINLKDQKLNIEYKNKVFSLSGRGKMKIDKKFENVKYLLSKKDKSYNFDINLNLENTKFQIDQLNFKKKNNIITELKLLGNYYEEDKYLNIKHFSILENKNIIKLEDLKLEENKLFKSINAAEFDYIDSENKQNQFIVKKISKDTYEVEGLFFNANSLISNLLDGEENKKNSISNNNIKLNISVDEVYLDEDYFVKNLNGDILFSNNKVNNASISANFKKNKSISFTIRTDQEDNKITTLSSSWAKPLVNRYKFISGFEDGYLDFYSSKKKGISNSKLIIDNFKVKEIPALAKLLSLASLQGIADLLTGEGIRFTDFEMNFSNEENFMKIDELYAIGPSISVLMEGYIEIDKLISLRGTLVPATTINRTIASIPYIGDLLIGKKTGEGVFGVSFKIKGPPNELETTVNPIKTLAPRFITRTLEKIKKN